MYTPPLCDLYVLDEDKQVRPATSCREWRRNLIKEPIVSTRTIDGIDVRTFFTGVNLNPGGPPFVFLTIVMGRCYPPCYSATYRDAMDSHWRAEWAMGRCVLYVETAVERRARMTGLNGGKREKRPARAAERKPVLLRAAPEQ